MNLRFTAVRALVLCSLVAGEAAFPALAQNAPAVAATPYPLPSIAPGRNVDPTVRQILQALPGVLGSGIAHFINSSTGTVTHYKGYDLEINVGSNRYREVHLHKGTTIQPTGETIRVGDRVEVGGDQQPDGSLNANAITIDH